MYSRQEVEMIYYDNEARRLFARERIELLQDDMHAARHVRFADLGALAVTLAVWGLVVLVSIELIATQLHGPTTNSTFG
jgi:hypothetical protein